MFRKATSVIMVAVFALLFIGCATHIHKVGNGAQGFDKVETRQWYILWGLIPLNDVDTNEIADGTADYTIQTQTAPLDIIMNIFTGYITVYSRTVTVTK